MKLKLVVITYGTEGDTRPLIALSKGLIEAGHRVCLLAERSGGLLAAGAGVPFQPLAGDMMAEVQNLASARLMRAGGSVTRLARAVAEIAERSTAAWMESLVRQAHGCDAILMSGLTSYVAFSVAEHLAVPVIGAGLQPMLPTREFPSPFLPPRRWPGWANRLSHWVVLYLMWGFFRKALSAAAVKITGQKPGIHLRSDIPTLFGISPQLVPQPADWPAHWQVVGAWSLPCSGWTPPATLQAFLDAGEPPLYIGFGSMAGFDQAPLLRTVVEAVQGRRTLFFPGWSGCDTRRLPGNFHTLEAVPHDWLFPRVAAVIHHGGAGTSHAAARAGVPSVVVPFAADQFFWADRLMRAGVAPAFMAYPRLDSRRLRHRIEQAQSPRMRARAAELGAAMRAERGVSNAVALIERMVRQRQDVAPLMIG